MGGLKNFSFVMICGLCTGFSTIQNSNVLTHSVSRTRVFRVLWYQIYVFSYLFQFSNNIHTVCPIRTPQGPRGSSLRVVFDRFSHCPVTFLSIQSYPDPTLVPSPRLSVSRRSIDSGPRTWSSSLTHSVLSLPQ